MLNILNFMFASTDNVMLIIMVVAILALLGGSFFMQKKNKFKELEGLKPMFESMKVGNKVVTNGGIVGEIISISDDQCTVNIKTGDGAVLTIFAHALSTSNYEEVAESYKNMQQNYEQYQIDLKAKADKKAGITTPETTAKADTPKAKTEEPKKDEVKAEESKEDKEDKKDKE